MSHKSINLWSHVTDQVIWTQGGKFEDFVMETKAVKWRNGCGLRGQTQHNKTDVCLQRNSVSSTGQVGFFWTLQRDWLTWFSCSFCTLLENWSSYSGLCLVDSHIFSSFLSLFCVHPDNSVFVWWSCFNCMLKCCTCKQHQFPSAELTRRKFRWERFICHGHVKRYCDAWDRERSIEVLKLFPCNYSWDSLL